MVMVGLFDQSWLSLCINHGWLLVCFRNNSLSRLRCSGVTSDYGWVTILLYYLWLNEHIYYFLTLCRTYHVGVGVSNHNGIPLSCGILE
jgi:hypothetical protein